MPFRVYLTGRMGVETPGKVVDEAAFPGRQGRLAFAFLALAAQRPVARDALADALWEEAPPPSWDAALKSVISRLRSVLVEAGVGAEPISAVTGCYQLRLPVETWIDLEACARCVDAAQAAIRRLDVERAWSEATVASAIARRTFLAGEDAAWVDTVRRDLRARHVQALETLAEVWLLRDNAALALSSASQAVGLEPFRETGYRLVMRAHALAGNRAEAVRTYERCERIFSAELGAEPDPETTALRDSLQVRRPATHPQTITIAVTDIVGSTALAARLGDKRWSEVLARHDVVMRHAVEAVGGQIVKHLGDGFLLTFASAGAALTALSSARVALGAAADGPIVTIRAGVHAGEPVEQGADVFGLQVNVAARISASAIEGQILVSSLIRDLAPPGQFQFCDPRTVKLKGLPEEVTIYRLT